MTDKEKRHHVEGLFRHPKFVEMVYNITGQYYLKDDYVQYIMESLLTMDNGKFQTILDDGDLFYYAIGMAKLCQSRTHPLYRKLQYNDHYGIASIDEEHKDGNNYYRENDMIAEGDDLHKDAMRYVYHRLKEVIEADEDLKQKHKDRFYEYMTQTYMVGLVEDSPYKYSEIMYSKDRVIDHIHTYYPRLFEELTKEFYEEVYPQLTKQNDEE